MGGGCHEAGQIDRASVEGLIESDALTRCSLRKSRAKRYRSARKLADWQKQESIEDALYAPFEHPGQEPRNPPSDD